MVRIYSPYHGSYSTTGRIAIKAKFYYKIEHQQLKSNKTNVGYSFSELAPFTRYDIMVGRVVPATQEIMNNFPLWTTMRIDPNAIAHKMMHAVGQHIEFVRSQIISMRNESFISTADITQTWKLYRVSNKRIGEISTSSTLDQVRSFRNLLENSDFSIQQPLRIRKAMFWLGTYSLDSTKSVFGTYSALLEDVGSVYQEVNLDNVIDTSNSLVFSFYYQTDATAVYEDELTLSALIHVIYDDDTRDIYRKAIPAYTSSKWNRFNIKIKPLKKISIIQTQVILRDNSSVSKINVDCAQLEIGESPSPWVGRASDRPWFILNNQIPRIHVGKKSDVLPRTSIWVLDDDYSFQYNVPPTRVKLTNLLFDDTATITSSWSRMVDHNRQEWPTRWRISNNKLQIENILVGNEVFFEYDIGEISPDSYQFIVYTNVTRTLLALTVYRDILYVLVKEVFQGRTEYYLKSVKPHVSQYTKTYLECYGEVRLNLEDWIKDLSPLSSYPTTGYKIAISDNDGSRLAIKLPDSRVLIYKLYFDYGFIDTTEAILYLREDYNSDGRLVTVL